MTRTKWTLSLVTCALLAGCAPRDDSDSPDTRSGLNIHRDALTGCEYLSRYKGGLTPRLDANGKQVCRGGEQ